MKKKVLRRLETYWKLEAVNVLLLPVLGWYLIVRAGGVISAPVLLAMSATAWVLVVGAATWKMEVLKLHGRNAQAQKLLNILARCRTPSAILVGTSTVGACFEWLQNGFSPAAIGAITFAVMAALEYVNYYVVQLQHFDHGSDFKRLLAGQGFREAHLAKAIRRGKS